MTEYDCSGRSRRHANIKGCDVTAVRSHGASNAMVGLCCCFMNSRQVVARRHRELCGWAQVQAEQPAAVLPLLALRPRSPPAFCADKLCVLVREATAVIPSGFGLGAVGASGARAASARADCGQPPARPPLDGTGPRLTARGGRE